ncbi:hypothetical protein [Micromonospora sp. NBC_00617]|uniref:hypothetical protein n=1 Tax=Micromonospora sp. NBC_00617 TaxID=2903587 RepID=UPI0030E100BE
MTFYEWRTQLRVYHALVLLADGRAPPRPPTPADGPTPAASSRRSARSSERHRAATGPAARAPINGPAVPRDRGS